MIILIVVAFALIAYVEISGLIKKKYKKELIVYGIFMLFAFVLYIFLASGLEFITPVEGFIDILKLLGLHF